MLKASWEGIERVVSSPGDLQEVIGTVRDLAEPTVLFLEHGNGRVLVVGLGAPESVLTFVEAGSVPSFHSVGDVERAGVLTFRCRDQLDEFMAEMAVPEAPAIAAAFEFQQTGERPSQVQWEADW